MKKKFSAMLLSVALILSMFSTALAATSTTEIVATGTEGDTSISVNVSATTMPDGDYWGAVWTLSGGTTDTLLVLFNAEVTGGKFSASVDVGRPLVAGENLRVAMSLQGSEDHRYYGDVVVGDAPVVRHTVIFNSNGGSAVDSQSVVDGSTATKPPNPTRSGYTFIGWYLNGTAYDFSTPVTGPITLVAQWDKKSSGGNGGGGSSTPSYTITAEKSDNGDFSVSKSARAGSTVTITTDPDEGYEVDEVNVTDKNGDPVEVKDIGNGKYTFKMPAGKVEIDVTFKPIEEAPPVEPPVEPSHDCLAENFSDVNLDEWYHDAIDYVLANGIMNGSTDGTFGPGADLNRAMFAQILFNMEGRPSPEVGGLFPDVLVDDWYYDAVNWAAAVNVVTGYETGDFGPLDPVTREQMVTMLYRYCQYKGIDVSVGESTNILSYPDAAQVQEYAVAAMQWAVGAGVIGGTTGPDGSLILDPSGTATRAQIAQMMMNFCERVAAAE